MNIEITPLNYIFWILFIFILYLFIINYKKIYIWTWIFPTVLFIILLQVKIHISYNMLYKPKILVDNNQSMLFTDINLLKNSLDRFIKKNKIDSLYTLNGKVVSMNHKKFDTSFKDLLSTKLELFQEENDILFTNDMYTQYILPHNNTNILKTRAKQNFISIPVKQGTINGIFNFDFPEFCYELKSCIFKVWVKSNKNQVLTLMINNNIIEQKVIPKNYSGWVTFHKQFKKNYTNTNLNASITLHTKNIDTVNKQPINHFENVPFIISIKKQIPVGYMYIPKISLMSWRMAHYMQKIPYWQLNKISVLKKRINSAYKMDFLSVINENNSLYELQSLFQYNLPILYVININDVYKYPIKKWEQIFENFYKVKNKFYVLVLNTASKNLFFKIVNIQDALSLFANTLQISHSPFQGGYIEPNSKLYIHQETTQKDLKYLSQYILPHKRHQLFKKNILIGTVLNFQNQKNFFYLPNTGQYLYNNFTFDVSIPFIERLKVYNYVINQENSLTSQSIDYQIKNLIIANTKYIPKKFTLSLSLTPYFSPHETILGKVIFIIFLILLCLLMWYLPIFKKN